MKLFRYINSKALNSFKHFLSCLKNHIPIYILKFHYLKIKIDYQGCLNKFSCFNGEIRELLYEDFLSGDKRVFNKSKLKIIEKRYLDNSYRAYGILQDGILLYSTWISLKKLGLPIRSTYNLSPQEGLLEDSYCHPTARGKGLHQMMIFYRLAKLYELDKKEAVVIVLDGNVPAEKALLKAGFINLGSFYIVNFLGISFSTLKKEKFDRRWGKYEGR